MCLALPPSEAITKGDSLSGMAAWKFTSHFTTYLHHSKQKNINLFSSFDLIRHFSTSKFLNIKRKHISKWKNSWPDQVYFEADLEERCFDKVLGTELKSRERRRRMFRVLLDRLVHKERVVVTFAKGKALSRLADLLIDTAKKDDEPAVYSLIQRKELIPRVFEDLLPRYTNQDGGYTKVYRLHSESLPSYRQGKMTNREAGNTVVEFVGNDLPPLLPTQEEQERLLLNHMLSKKHGKDNVVDGTHL